MESNKMTDQTIVSKVQDSMYRQCQKRGYAAPVDVLQKSKYEEWRFGRVSILEGVCTANLKKLPLIMRQVKKHAQKIS